MQTYCSFPPILDIEEFSNNIKNFPNYLLSSIICNACLNSPHPELYCKNINYSDYYYKLSLSQLNSCISVPSIFMIQTLLILSLIDDAMGRPLQKGERVTAAVRLALSLGMDKVEEFNELTKPSHFGNIPYLTIRKLWFFVKYWDAQISKVMNTPTMIKASQDDPDYYHPKPLTELPIIKTCKNLLPKEYIDMFTLYMKFGSLVIRENEIIEIELRTKPPQIKLLKCIENLEKIESFLIKEVPQHLSYTPTCLIKEEFTKNPLTRIKLVFYQKVLDIALQITQLSLLLNVNDIQLILELIDKFSVVSKKLLKLLEDQNLTIIKFNLSNVVEDDTYSYPILININNLLNVGHLYLDFISYLNKLNTLNQLKFKSISNLAALLECDFLNFVKQLKVLGSYWKDSKLVLDSVLPKYKELQASLGCRDTYEGKLDEQ